MIDDYLSLANEYYKDIEHPLCVANSFEELSDEWIVGLLHDILEDTDIDEDELLSFLTYRNKGHLYTEIQSITHSEFETYFEYIIRLAGIAKVVKLADLRHNLSRTKTLKDSLKKRYTKALNLLNNQYEGGNKI